MKSRIDWIFANPWFSALGGLFLSIGAFSCARFLGDEPRWLRFSLVMSGLLAAGIAVWLRLDFDKPTFVSSWSTTARNLLLAGFMVLFASFALAITALFALSLFQPDVVFWRWGTLLIWWLIVAPITGAGAYQCLRRIRQTDPLEAREEAAGILIVAAVTQFLCLWALYLPDYPDDLISARLFLGIFGTITLVAAPLVMISTQARRQAISLLILLHFAGIATATLAVPPAPAVVAQLWTRIYRPYLEFFYINNAYHFYSPEPGPASFLWFRVIFTDDKGNDWGEWLKIPRLDDHGNRLRPALSHSRHLALTENVVHSAPKNLFEISPEGKLELSRFYQRRVINSPSAASAPKIVGIEAPRATQVVPFHPDIAQNQQYSYPNKLAETMIPSFAKRAMIEMAEQNADKIRTGYRVKSAKVYRVTHAIVPHQMLSKTRIDPTDPTLYRGTFLGEFDPDGKLIDPDDPHLYWLLPTLKDSPGADDSLIRCYMRRHAGDPAWVRGPDGKWITPEVVLP